MEVGVHGSRRVEWIQETLSIPGNRLQNFTIGSYGFN